MRYQLVTRRPCALGNGDRRENEVLAQIELAEGVTVQELVNGLLNLDSGPCKLMGHGPAPPAPETVVDPEPAAPVEFETDPAKPQPRRSRRNQ